MPANRLLLLGLTLLSLLLAACSQKPTPTSRPAQSSQPSYQGVDGLVPQFEPYSRIGNKDYDVLGHHYKVWSGIDSYTEEGIASWYGPGFHGLNTSNGERYDQASLSAAHKNLPLPSYLKVTNLDNGKQLIVRVNDRGPFHDNRILDLSFGAATKLGVVAPGTARVRLELIKVPAPANAAEILARHEARTIQLMATASADKANATAAQLQRQYGMTFKVVTADPLYRLQLGPLERAQAEKMLSTLRQDGYRQAFFIN
ncbi:septal ring lytic transglycosylase RlpA family protein [Pseudaeromonas sp. ZJS20]|uniref:septal ring lytic transglycosylase RlpA family protein n=1 Tax=Pseudaeromonas aegiceratis TaxID=3153928 RepID=UPI00390CD487